MPNLPLFPASDNWAVELVAELMSPRQAPDDAFEGLLRQMRVAHNDKIRELTLEVESLQKLLAQRQGEAPPQSDSPSQQHGPHAPSKQHEPHGALASGDSPREKPKSSFVPNTGTKASTPQATPSGAGDLGSVGFAPPVSAEGRGLSNTAHRQRMVEEEIKSKDLLFQMVHNPAFETLGAALVALFGLVMAFEAQFFGLDVALATGHASASTPSRLVWADGKGVLTTLQAIFGVVFLVEMILKIAGLRWKFWIDPWNWLDLAVNVLWIYSLLEITPMPVNPQIVRIARLARLLRLIRLVSFLEGQHSDSLHLMTTAVRGSVSILAWSMVLLLLIHIMLSIFLNQILRETYFDIDNLETAKAQVQVYEYFGTFSRSLLTMFEITLANWPPACRILIEHVSEWFILYAVLHKMVLGFAVIGVVNGVFIQETFKVATLDDAVMVRQMARKQQVHQDKMMRLFEEADSNGDGYIDVEEWHSICEDDWVKIWLASQDLNAGDAQSLFKLLDDGDGQLGAQELVRGASRLRGAAATIEMFKLGKKLDGVLMKMDTFFPEGSAHASHDGVGGTRI